MTSMTVFEWEGGGGGIGMVFDCFFCFFFFSFYIFSDIETVKRANTVFKMNCDSMCDFLVKQLFI